MPVMRKPFNPSGATISGDGAGAPGAAMPTKATTMGAQPTMPMGGKPHGDPLMGGKPQQGPMGAAPPIPPPATAESPGGPTSPLNIGQMLTAQMQGGGQPGGAVPSLSSMPAWGDEGTRGPAGPARVPFGGGDRIGMPLPPSTKPRGGGMGGGGGVGMQPIGGDDRVGYGDDRLGGEDRAGANIPETMLRLLRGMGRV